MSPSSCLRSSLAGFTRPSRLFRPYSTQGDHYDILVPSEPYIFGVEHIKPRKVPSHILRPPYVTKAGDAEKPSRSACIVLGGGDERKLRSAARLARVICDFAGTLVKPGVTTDFIDAQVHARILSHNAYPSPLLYKGFPKSCCTSVNNVMVHGIPDDRPLRNGDIINIDITVFLEGYHGDTSRTFLVGNVDENGHQLINLTSRALQAGIEACGPNKPYKGIGRAIHNLVRSQSEDYCVSPQFTGHGIGTEFHSPPWILHHLNDEPGLMQPGDCFTIEPNIIEGNDPQGALCPDGWTVITESCTRSAQEEDMVLITEDGAEVITRI